MCIYMKRFLNAALLSRATAACVALTLASTSSAIAGICNMHKQNASAMQNEQIDDKQTDKKKVET
ncbi:hypothetical protein CREGCYN_08040 [Synechococcus sp. M16CYN]